VPPTVDPFARDNLPAPALWPEMPRGGLQYPARLNCAAVLLAGAGAPDDAPAIHFAGGMWTYGRLRREVARIAAVLRAQDGWMAGRRVLLRGANDPMTAACFLAVILAGGIVVPTMPLLRARELAAVIDKAAVNLALCAAPLAGELLAARPHVAGALPPVLWYGADAVDAASLEARMARLERETDHVADTADEDVCLIAFTSGTTGVPKATAHCQRDLLAICDCFPRSILETRRDDIFIGTPPLAFTFGLGGLLLFPLRVGAATVLLGKGTPEQLLAAIVHYRATICFTAPTFYRQMAPLAKQYDLSRLRCGVSAGEALPLATRDAWFDATGQALIDGIGSTELLHIFISAAGGDVRRGATGRPIPGYQACILDADGRPAGPGVVGRLAVKGPTGCRYLADERQRDYVVDGWNLTGDAYEMDADGYFYYRSRTDDLIVSGGYNIAGPEVEEALLRHPAVAECAVIGRADAARGHIVEAHVVLRAGSAASAALAGQLQDFVKAQIAPYKYPRAIRFVPALPRTETGKLQRFKLRAP
jgi:2-aminobenzoate-CoA ligase